MGTLVKVRKVARVLVDDNGPKHKRRPVVVLREGDDCGAHHGTIRFVCNKSTWKRRPAILTSLPHLYVKAGLTLLDIIQASPSVFPVPSHELFSVLDDASENTFMCWDSLSVQHAYLQAEIWGVLGSQLLPVYKEA
ncbi:hypothetical protein HPP92_001484 [Vanilla planifolia]|uniref:Uncharacterized protein n=1 Tax=Vanilla planifolia TaxID=51239 RepID=A0A835VGZ7_VANPL|nr:hypothetical protein HPP92_001484 [Vanilla planifolia]